jgi:hypothetical protein
MYIEIPDNVIAEMLKTSIRKKIDDLLSYGSDSKDKLNKAIEDEFNKQIVLFNFIKLVSNKIGYIFDDCVESYLREKDKEAVKKAFVELTKQQKTDQTELGI